MPHDSTSEPTLPLSEPRLAAHDSDAAARERINNTDTTTETGAAKADEAKADVPAAGTSGSDAADDSARADGKSDTDSPNQTTPAGRGETSASGSRTGSLGAPASVTGSGSAARNGLEGAAQDAGGSRQRTAASRSRQSSSGKGRASSRPVAKAAAVIADESNAAATSGGTVARMDSGDELEMRLARVLFWEGSYTRRGIDLERQFASAALTVTDLDLLAVDFDPQLNPRRTIGEAKSGTGKNAPKPLDRALWLAGVARLVGADRGELVTARVPNPRIRATAAELNITAMSITDIDRREAAAEVAAVADIGAHGPTAFTRVDAARLRLRREPELERAFWFLRSEVWFQSPWIAAKRTLGVLQTAKKWFTPQLEDDDNKAMRWLISEAVSVLTLNLVALCGHARHADSDMWADTVREKLAEGAVPLPQMRALSDHIDTFVARAVAASGGRATPEIIGAFMPTAPHYTDAFIELTTRLARVKPIAALPRHLDLVVFERLLHRRHVNQSGLERVTGINGQDLAGARRLIAAFLRGADAHIDILDTALTTDTDPSATADT